MTVAVAMIGMSMSAMSVVIVPGVRRRSLLACANLRLGRAQYRANKAGHSQKDHRNQR